jgi:hypothetical protein
MQRLTPFIMPPFMHPSAFDISFPEDIRPTPEPPDLDLLDLTGTRVGKRKNDLHSGRFDKQPQSIEKLTGSSSFESWLLSHNTTSCAPLCSQDKRNPRNPRHASDRRGYARRTRRLQRKVDHDFVRFFILRCRA